MKGHVSKDRKKCSLYSLFVCLFVFPESIGAVGENEEYVKPKSEAKFDVSSFSLPESAAIPEQCMY